MLCLLWEAQRGVLSFPRLSPGWGVEFSLDGSAAAAAVPSLTTSPV